MTEKHRIKWKTRQGGSRTVQPKKTRKRKKVKETQNVKAS